MWVNRTFWLSWVLLLFNLLPAFPLDGGQMLQAADLGAGPTTAAGTSVAATPGSSSAVLFLVVSIAANEALLHGAGLFMLYTSSMKLHALEAEDGRVRVRLLAGYTSLERDDEPPPRPKRPGVLTRWLQARPARQAAARGRAAAGRRTSGWTSCWTRSPGPARTSLTDEERRFLERVSARYRNR